MSFSRYKDKAKGIAAKIALTYGPRIGALRVSEQAAQQKQQVNQQAIQGKQQQLQQLRLQQANIYTPDGQFRTDLSAANQNSDAPWQTLMSINNLQANNPPFGKFLTGINLNHLLSIDQQLRAKQAAMSQQLQIQYMNDYVALPTQRIRDRRTAIENYINGVNGNNNAPGTFQHDLQQKLQSLAQLAQRINTDHPNVGFNLNVNHDFLNNNIPADPYQPQAPQINQNIMIGGGNVNPQPIQLAGSDLYEALDNEWTAFKAFAANGMQELTNELDFLTNLVDPNHQHGVIGKMGQWLQAAQIDANLNVAQAQFVQQEAALNQEIVVANAREQVNGDIHGELAAAALLKQGIANDLGAIPADERQAIAQALPFVHGAQAQSKGKRVIEAVADALQQPNDDARLDALKQVYETADTRVWIDKENSFYNGATPIRAQAVQIQTQYATAFAQFKTEALAAANAGHPVEFAPDPTQPANVITLGAAALNAQPPNDANALIAIPLALRGKIIVADGTYAVDRAQPTQDNPTVEAEVVEYKQNGNLVETQAIWRNFNIDHARGIAKPVQQVRAEAETILTAAITQLTTQFPLAAGEKYIHFWVARKREYELRVVNSNNPLSYNYAPANVLKEFIKISNQKLSEHLAAQKCNLLVTGKADFTQQQAQAPENMIITNKEIVKVRP